VTWPFAYLGDVTRKIGSGSTPRGGGESYKDHGVPLIRSMNVHDGEFIEDGIAYLDERQAALLKHVTLDCGDVLFNITGASVARVCRLPDSFSGGRVNQHVSIIRPDQNKLNPHFLEHLLRAPEAKSSLLRVAGSGATREAITKAQLEEFRIPLPPLDEQRRLAAILDKADALRRKRKRALGLLDGLIQSIFLKMFGDPAINSCKYPLRTFGEISEKMSDGPFGSNLKSDHYVANGVRVVRLQNIGVGEFIDDDQAFISNEHFRSLSKHKCLPGDVLVGTLGDPNLRACLQPNWLRIALNKADCVQIRPDQNIALPEYVVALLNQPSTERLAHGLMLGQTRTRISMGRLRELQVPIAPLKEQIRFVGAVRQISKMRDNVQTAGGHTRSLFSSLQSRAFSGQL
jgi:type I restriction enzyme, S subunit